MKFAIFVYIALLLAASAFCLRDVNVVKFDANIPNCPRDFCKVKWTANTPLEDLCKSCFAKVVGNEIVFVDNFTQIAELVLGSEQWENAIVVITKELKIFYDPQPYITHVQARALRNGRVEIKVVGQNFGFSSSGVKVTLIDSFQDVPEKDCFVDENVKKFTPNRDGSPPCPGRPSVLTYPGPSYECQNTTLFHRDTHIACLADFDLKPGGFQIFVEANGKKAFFQVDTSYIR